MKKIIDLTYDIEEGMLSFPSHWHIPVEISILGRHSLEHRETRKITFSTHTGTHIDAPTHFIKNAKTLTEIPLEKLVGEAVLLDFSFVKAGEQVTKDMLVIKLKNKQIKKIISFFDWGKYWNSDKFYNNWPYFSKDAIKYLVNELKIDFLGMDTPSPDYYQNGWKTGNDSPNHKILLSNEVVICEYMANLNKIEKEIFDLFVLPIKIKNSDGAPVRCIAIY